LQWRRVSVEPITVGASNLIFDLRRGPLMRAILLRLSSRDHVLVMILNHLIFDGWSLVMTGMAARQLPG